MTTEQHDLLKRLLDRAAIADARRAGSEHNGMSIMAQEEASAAADLRAAASRIEALESRVGVLEGALGTIRDRHIPDQPMADDCDEAEYARSQHTALRVIALRALAGDTP